MAREQYMGSPIIRSGTQIVNKLWKNENSKQGCPNIRFVTYLGQVFNLRRT
jgi:hypothetical protein